LGALWTTIFLVFVAELGDKSQLLALSLGARHRLIPLMAGAFCAFALTSLLSVTIGGLIAVAVPSSVIAYASGLVFCGFGVWTLWPVISRSAVSGSGQSTNSDHSATENPKSQTRKSDTGKSDTGKSDTGRSDTGKSDTGTWWRVFTLAFVAMFLAEFGDKTMLVSATLAARSNLVIVWIGSTIAITLSTLIGASLGRYLDGKISERNLRIGSGGLFVLVGLLMILGGFRA
jgi:putative Ca2+/H+ antiporter (TMEM165/GDT1 family)